MQILSQFFQFLLNLCLTPSGFLDTLNLAVSEKLEEEEEKLARALEVPGRKGVLGSAGRQPTRVFGKPGLGTQGGWAFPCLPWGSSVLLHESGSRFRAA